MAESLELWQRLGHASYRDWVLAAEKARRVAKAANKAAAKATARVQPSPTSALQLVPQPTLAPPPLHRLPYREELVATWDPSEYLVNIGLGRGTTQKRVTGGRWRRIVLGDVLV